MRLSDDSYFGLPSYCEELFSFQSFKPKYVCLDFIERKDSAAVVTRGVSHKEWEERGSVLGKKTTNDLTEFNVIKMYTL